MEMGALTRAENGMLWKNCSGNSGIVTGLREKELLGTCKHGHGTGSHLHKFKSNFTVIMRVVPLLSLNCAGVKKRMLKDGRETWAREKDSRFERSWRRVVVTLQWTSRIPSTSVIRGQISSGICSSAIRSRERKQVRAVYIIRYNLWTHNRWQILFRIMCCGTDMLEQNINENQLHPGTCEETKKVLKLTGNQKIWVSNSLDCIELCPIPQTSTSGSEWWSQLLPVSRKVRRDKYHTDKARRRNSMRVDVQRTSQIFETSKYIMLSLHLSV